MDNIELLRLAEDARQHSYAPYSGFRVGAALLTKSGKVYTGCNIECASLGGTNCAERTAIFKGVHEGNREIKAVAVVGDTSAYTYPCGICRQVIAEFIADEKVPVIIIKNENDYIVKTFEEILPGVFSKKDLKG